MSIQFRYRGIYLSLLIHLSFPLSKCAVSIRFWSRGQGFLFGRVSSLQIIQMKNEDRKTLLDGLAKSQKPALQ